MNNFLPVPASKKAPLVYMGMTLLMGCAGHQQEPVEKPNVLILFSDQHSKLIMGFENHPDVITPNLDRLAKESVVFNRAYCNVGICAPSRTSLMTGLYPRTLGLLSNAGNTQVMKEAVSLATIFQQNGYKTYAYGKRHTRQGADLGWDHHRSHLCHETPGDNYVNWVEAQGLGDELTYDWAAEFGRGPACLDSTYTDYPVADLGTRISRLPEHATMEAFTTQLTIDMIKDHAVSGEPFFCWATFYRPHQPYTPQQRFFDMYDVNDWGRGTRHGDKIRKPESLYEPKENLPPLMQSIREGGNKVWNVDKAFENEQLWRDYIGAYYALVTEIDYYIGEIIQALEDAGTLEETIIIYSSDHGDFVGNHGMVEKAAMGHNVYEDILNIPLMVRYPGGQTKPFTSDDLVLLVDVFPTIIDLVGLEVPEMKHEPEGYSFAGLFTGESTYTREYVVSESWSQATVITKDHKLGIWLDPGKSRSVYDYRDFGDMFFVRADDPLEINNQIDNPAYRETVDSLRTLYEAFTEKVPGLGKAELLNSQ